MPHSNNDPPYCKLLQWNVRGCAQRNGPDEMADIGDVHSHGEGAVSEGIN